MVKLTCSQIQILLLTKLGIEVSSEVFSAEVGGFGPTMTIENSKYPKVRSETLICKKLLTKKINENFDLPYPPVFCGIMSFG